MWGREIDAKAENLFPLPILSLEFESSVLENSIEILDSKRRNHLFMEGPSHDGGRQVEVGEWETGHLVGET